METISFVLGVLSIIGVAVVTLVVVGMVKIHNLNKVNEALQSQLDETVTHLDRSISDETRAMHSSMEEMMRHTQCYSEEQKQEIISYVDSRIDKLQAKKEVLKG
jgi:predicted PurR-regulated permease PerM